MSDQETITIKVDSRLKQHIESAAKARNQTFEAAAIQALKLWSADRCPTCGRSTESETVSAGMTDDFRKFVELYAPGNYGNVTITTLEAGEQKAYWVRIRSEPNVQGALMEGMVMVDALLGSHGNARLHIGIPRGVITGWRHDHDGTWYGMCVALGYVDGNGPARQVALLMKQQGQL